MKSSFAPVSSIHPRGDTLYVTQGRTVLATDRDGLIHGGPQHGLFCFETRLLSRYEMMINGKTPHPNVLSNVEQHSWIGYYTFLDEAWTENKETDRGSGQMNQESEETLELRISRYVGGGIHEDLDFKNYTGKKISFEFSMVIEADFADIQETSGDRRQNGTKEVNWKENTLLFNYKCSNKFKHQDISGKKSIQRSIKLKFHSFSSQPVYRDGRIFFSIELGPYETWHTCIDHTPGIENRDLKSIYTCHAFEGQDNYYDRTRENFLESSATALAPHSGGLTPVVIGAFEEARRDLVSMRLFDLDKDENSWTTGAGLPIYTSFYGRDTLTSSWQAGIFGPEMMKGSLKVLKAHQGKRTINWFDEEPGRMVHEMHEGPLAALHFNNLSHNYGSVTTAHLYPFILSQLWHWTGDRKVVEELIPAALKAIEWMDKLEIRDGKGFYYYHTHSKTGVKHQGWKDSPSGIVNSQGRSVDPPIAMCEEQAFAYVSKYFFAEVLWHFGRKKEAMKLFRDARELKKHFNEQFWLEEEGYFAMGLGPDKKPLHVIGSDPGHCIAAGIVDKALIKRTADRMFEKDLFSGWGIRTLSDQNPAFNPYSYHRGSVWPVESGTFSLGFMRYGLWDHLEKIGRSFFEMCSLFEFYRPPEVISGHKRDRDHPLPALYPKANSPQAWSASAVASVVTALVGLYPYAPKKILMVDPHLPSWLPEIQINNIRVGQSKISIRFYRRSDGTSTYTIVDQEGDLKVIHQSSPWSISTSPIERLSHFMDSFLH